MTDAIDQRKSILEQLDGQFNRDCPLRIGYFADGPWSHNAFRKIINDERFSIAFVCVRYDTQDQVLQELSQQYAIPCLRHRNINSPQFLSVLRAFECDLFVSMSFNQIFKRELIDIPRFKVINCHAGELPFYRGRNVLNWALINDEKQFGVTVHYVDEGVDTGDIILQDRYPIRDNDSYSSLLARSYIYCAELLYKALCLFENGSPIGIKQASIHPVGSYCTQRQTGDETLKWQQTSREIFNFVRALSKPGPMARAFLNGNEMTINAVEEIDGAPIYKGIVGAILKKDKDGFLVKTEDSFVKVIDYEYEYSFRIGDRFL